MRKRHFLLTIFLALIISCGKNKTLHFYPLSPYKSIIKAGENPNGAVKSFIEIRYLIVEDKVLNDDLLSFKKQAIAYLEKSISPKIKGTSDYVIEFYNTSQNFDKGYNYSESNSFLDHDENHLGTARYKNGKLVIFEYYKNGVLISDIVK
jgi:hypothetical protein